MDIRGEVKQLNVSIIKPISFMGAEKEFGVSNLLFFVLMITFTFPSWWTLFFFILFLFLMAVGKAVYKNDPYFFTNYVKNSFYSAESRKYLFTAPNTNYKRKKAYKPRSVR
uniref:Uncharacterized protein n=1 Tax=Francisella tularensis subsp. novicida PA10-7858 TaxID=1386968 RepID=V5TAW3_FRANO|nr:VirB3 family type IV secretion system protein [Francisella tularensis]AHB60773.1 hypothetical protein N894_0005 [Francisella tularensis subsp. novicida PA10-7858]